MARSIYSQQELAEILWLFLTSVLHVSRFAGGRTETSLLLRMCPYYSARTTKDGECQEGVWPELYYVPVESHILWRPCVTAQCCKPNLFQPFRKLSPVPCCSAGARCRIRYLLNTRAQHFIIASSQSAETPIVWPLRLSALGLRQCT
jgi:hypothetical protein